MALYHQYRPTSFDSVVGQTPITQTLKQQLLQDAVGHAYLFFGPRGVGKTSTARILAKAINCEKRKDKEADPCNDCPSCTAINAGAAIDIIEIDAASHTGVDHVREHIIEQAQFQPSQAKYRVFIIDEAHMLSTSACNALLKTLEEPPARTLFVLATTELEKLPQTVVSRCQRMTFARVAHDDMVAHLSHIAKDQKRTVDEAVLSHISDLSEGCVRDAVSLLEQILTIDSESISAEDAKAYLPASYSKEAADLLQSLLKKDAASALSVVGSLHAEGVRIVHVFDDLIRVGREQLLTGGNTQELVSILDKAIKRKRDVALSPIAVLPLELLIMEIVQPTTPVTSSTPAPQPKPSVSPAPEPVVEEVVPEPRKEEVQEPSVPEKTPEAPAQEIEAPPVETPSINKETSPTSEQEVETHWPAIREAVSKNQPSLRITLGQTIASAKDGALVLSLTSSFHADRIDKPEINKIIADAAAEVVGHGVNIKIVVDETAKPDNSPSDAVSSLASALGGDII